MRIYSMTATFGKLEHETLTLKPGLNVIHAPNEWGKSTWCAFLLNMLYGIDTRERTKLDSLADKDRYAPWSGSPMSGRISLNWNGRDITIERNSNARIPMGVFRAYETDTGLDVPELTGSNCGQMLLGVERNVFTRSGFLRLTDMPVTQDEALRRRLNNLVTTGDESGDADKLAQKLKDLKNKCRTNRSNGLLPEAEALRDQLRSQLWDLQDLENQIQQNKTQQYMLDETLLSLENHRTALEYEASKENIRRVEQAKATQHEALQALEVLKARCAQLPDRQTVLARVNLLEQLHLQQTVMDAEILPPVPDAPVPPSPFTGMSADQALQKARSDKAAYEMLCKKLSPVPVILMILSIIAGLALLFINPLLSLPFPVLAIGLFAIHLRNKACQKRDRLAVAARYEQLSPDEWINLAVEYQNAYALFEEQLTSCKALSNNLSERKDALAQAVADAAEGLPLSDGICKWKEILAQLDSLQEAQRVWEQTCHHAEALAAVAKTAEPPKQADTLTLTLQETLQAIAKVQFEQKQLQLQLGQYQGQMDALGQPAVIKAKLDAVNQRIARLESYNNAIELAQNALFKATVALQRRFSPKITKRAQTLFAQLTGQRYQRIIMSEDLSLQTAATCEDTLRELRRRSDGTVDQLYLALRLAVAEQLTPNAPLVLDDALIRFDDDRLALAMDILKEEAQSKQVILFTCQKRETYLS